MEVKPGGNNDARLLNNRALALTKAGKHAAAALDAARACELEPRWTKAWFRLGTAQLGAGRALAAVDAFSIGLRLDQSCKNTRGSLRRAVLRLTREEVAAKLLQMIEAAQARGWLTKPTAEEVDPDVKQEAMFRHIQLFHRDKPTPGDYYEYIVLWLEEGLTPGALQARASSLCGVSAFHSISDDLHLLAFIRSGLHSALTDVPSCEMLRTSCGGCCRGCQGLPVLCPGFGEAAAQWPQPRRANGDACSSAGNNTPISTSAA